MAKRPKRTRNRDLEARRARAEAERRLFEEDGLELPSRPKDDRPPRVPEDIADLDDDDLMALMTRLTRWSEWLNVRLTLAEIEASSAKEQLDQVRNLAILGGSGGSYESVTEAKAAASQDPDVVEWTRKHSVADSQRKLLKSMYEAHQEKSFVVSRELTRRVGRDPYERRTSRWGGA